MFRERDSAQRKSVFPKRRAGSTITRSASKLLDNVADDRRYLEAVARWENTATSIQLLFQSDESSRADLLAVKHRCTAVGLAAELQRVVEVVFNVTESAVKLCAST